MLLLANNKVSFCLVFSILHNVCVLLIKVVASKSLSRKDYKMNVTNPISLEQRLQNVKVSNLTELNAIRNIISKIILIPFSDFMFFHQKEYLLIMTEFTNHEQTSDFPNVITGQVFEYIVRRIGKYIKTDESGHALGRSDCRLFSDRGDCSAADIAI